MQRKTFYSYNEAILKNVFKTINFYQQLII